MEISKPDAPECINSDMPPYRRAGCIHGYKWGGHCDTCAAVSKLSKDELAAVSEAIRSRRGRE